MRSYSPTVTPAGTSIWISTFAVAMGSSVNQEIGCFQLHPTLCRHRLAAKGQNAQRCTYQRESRSRFVDDQGKESLNFQINLLVQALIGVVATIVLSFVTCGFGLF